METRNSKQTKERMIHVRLPEAMHKKVRIRAAETGQTIQDWAFEAFQVFIASNIGASRKPKKPSVLAGLSSNPLVAGVGFLIDPDKCLLAVGLPLPLSPA